MIKKIYKIDKRVNANPITMALEEQYIVYEIKNKFWSKLFKCWNSRGMFKSHQKAKEYVDLLKETELYASDKETLY